MFRIRLYDTYNLAKEMYAKPRLKWMFCRWRKSPLLPVWRRGNKIKLYKRYDEIKEIRDKFTFRYEWSDIGKKSHPVLSKIFKKPIYTLPVWLSVYIFNHDLIWKTKYNDYRFEFPPQFCIVMFGWSLNIWLVAPKCNYPESAKTFTTDDDYWESMLWYIEYKNRFPERNRKLSGGWRDGNGIYYDKIRKEFFKERYRKYMKVSDEQTTKA